jgi:hypothetical protein
MSLLKLPLNLRWSLLNFDQIVINFERYMTFERIQGEQEFSF